MVLLDLQRVVLHLVEDILLLLRLERSLHAHYLVLLLDLLVIHALVGHLHPLGQRRLREVQPALLEPQLEFRVLLAVRLDLLVQVLRPPHVSNLLESVK